MGWIAVMVLVLVSITVDVLWIDIERKRWSWLNNSTKLQLAIFLGAFSVVSGVIYYVMS
ncbi:hypothetical protein [Oceanobacillus jordanicus]|uniref:Cardiolipin synthase N-terminal domain-containing protein n=1 Tax=Oceanobacillus jordanicus TaxID=2867266 RepID=A0AAW5B606_9BACI|nr:hypothetical protein [Oceanobacillus jordanicus]MCG3418624.1 hypothetical protein [Oceanobacillus jordanicus]